MSFFNTSVKAEDLAEQDGNFLNKSGIYDVILKIVSVDINDKQARSLNFNVEYNNAPATLYGLKLDNNDGTPNFQRAIFNRLCVIAGLETVNDPETETHKLGKDGVERELLVLKDFEGMPVKVRVQTEFSKYNGEIKKRLVIRNFYRDGDGATAEEIALDANGETVTLGAKLEKDRAYADDVTYQNGVTAEEAAAYSSSNKSGGSAAPKPKTAPRPGKSMFKK